jgi:type I restriction enzyme, S subunit
MTFARYPKYKKSQSDLVVEIPSSWEKSRVRNLTSIKKGRLPVLAYSEPQASSDLPYLSMEYLRGDKETISSTFVPIDGSSIKAQDEDILVLWDGSNAGEFLRAKQGVVSSTLARVLPVGIDRDYLFYSLKSAEKVLKDQSIGMGIPHVSSEVLKDLAVFVPPLDEQRSIASFLRQETKKIDKLIAEQEKLIELLKEKRHVVISHAVTKGLDPNVKTKRSGIEWVGEVPTHWVVMPLKWDLKFLTSGSRGWADYYSDSGSLFIRIGNLTRDGIDLDFSDIQRVNVPDGSEGERTKVKHGDILFSITAYLGSVAVVPKNIEDAYVSQHVALARLNHKFLTPEWVAFVTKSIVGSAYLESQGYGGTKIQLSLDDVANLPIPHPPISEQEIIVKTLYESLKRFDELRGESEKVINVLKERRSALISAAVTGQIDVRTFNPESEAV